MSEEATLQQQIRWAMDTMEYFCQSRQYLLEIDPASDPYGMRAEEGVRKFMLKFTITIPGDSMQQQYFCLIETNHIELCAKLRLIQRMIN